VASPRAVRIPSAKGAARAVRLPIGGAPGREPGPGAADAPEVRKNTAGLERARRLVAIYLFSLFVLYVGFVVVDLTGPGAGAMTGGSGFDVFSGLAAAFAVGGLVLTLSPVPRAVELTTSGVVVVEWTGRRRQFPPLEELRVDVVRRYPAGLLSSSEVEAVEVTGGSGRRTYQLTRGLLPERRPIAALA
jgi:hypothetical protein